MANVYSVNLNGSSAFSATDHADFKPTGNFTVGCWLKFSSPVPYNIGIFDSYYYQDGNKIAGWKLGLDYTNGVYPTLISGKKTGTTYGTDVQQVASSINCGNGVWHWAVGTWDGTNLNMYVDGGNKVSQAWSYAPAYATTNNIRVGCINLGSDSSFYTGNLDEIFLINGTAWNDAKVAAMYRNYITGETNLKAYYQLENNGNDSSGNSHTLSAIGSPTYQTDVPVIGVNSNFFMFM